MFSTWQDENSRNGSYPDKKMGGKPRNKEHTQESKEAEQGVAIWHTNRHSHEKKRALILFRQLNNYHQDNLKHDQLCKKSWKWLNIFQDFQVKYVFFEF